MAVNVNFTDETLHIKSAEEPRELWRVLRTTTTNKQKKCVIHEKDLIKLGNFHCYVKKIHIIEGNNFNEKSTISSQDLAYNAEMNDEIEDVKEISKNVQNCISNVPHFIQMKLEATGLNTSMETYPKICRICLSEENESSDPLINPCKCSGSMKYIHLECLRKWLINKIEIVEDEVIRIYAWKDLNCELCKGPFKSKENY